MEGVIIVIVVLVVIWAILYFITEYKVCNIPDYVFTMKIYPNNFRKMIHNFLDRVPQSMSKELPFIIFAMTLELMEYCSKMRLLVTIEGCQSFVLYELIAVGYTSMARLKQANDKVSEFFKSETALKKYIADTFGEDSFIYRDAINVLSKWNMA